MLFLKCKLSASWSFSFLQAVAKRVVAADSAPVQAAVVSTSPSCHRHSWCLNGAVELIPTLQDSKRLYRLLQDTADFENTDIKKCCCHIAENWKGGEGKKSESGYCHCGVFPPALLAGVQDVTVVYVFCHLEQHKLCGWTIICCKRTEYQMNVHVCVHVCVCVLGEEVCSQ